MDGGTEPTETNDAAVYQAWVITLQTAALLQQAVDARLRPHRLTWVQAATLAVLGRHGPQPLHALARYLLYQTQTLTDLVDRLERRALVRRSRHPRDRRSVLVELTADGGDVAAAAEAVFAEVAAATFGREDDAALTAVGDTLRRVRDAAAAVAGIPADHLAYATERFPLHIRSEPAQ